MENWFFSKFKILSLKCGKTQRLILFLFFSFYFFIFFTFFFSILQWDIQNTDTAYMYIYTCTWSETLPSIFNYKYVYMCTPVS